MCCMWCWICLFTKMKIFRQNGCFFLLGKNNFISHLFFCCCDTFERKKKKWKKKRRRSLSCVARQTSNHVWSEDASAEKADRGERCVGFDREWRWYLFPTHSSEIEFDGCEILVRGEYGDEKVGEEIVSRGWFEKGVLDWRDVVDIDFGVCVGA